MIYEEQIPYMSRRQGKTAKRLRNGPAPRRRKMGGRMGGLLPRPPSLNSVQIKHSRTLRFVSNAAIGQNITYANLLDTMIYSTTAILGYDLFQLVKIRWVRMWYDSVSGTPGTVNLQYVNVTTGLEGDQDYHSGTSMGLEPAYLVAIPKARSAASFFHESSTAVAFSLVCPQGTVIDVGLDLVATPGMYAQAAANALVGATTGVTYFRGLDGLAKATSAMPPAYGVNITQ